MSNTLREPATLSRKKKQEKAIALLAKGHSNVFVSQCVGVAEGTIRNWLKKPEFAARVEEVQKKQILIAERILAGYAARAARNLGKIATGQRQKARMVEVTAAKDVLDRLGVGKGKRIEVSGSLDMSDAELDQLIAAELGEEG